MKNPKEAHAPAPTPENSGSIPKRGRGAPKGNRNARKHGAYSAAMEEQRSEARELRQAIEAMITLLRLRMIEKGESPTLH